MLSSSGCTVDSMGEHTDHPFMKTYNFFYPVFNL